MILTKKKPIHYLLLTGILPLLIWSVVIFSFSNRQKVAFVDNYTVSFFIFKTLHVLEYTVLYFLWVRVFHLLKIKNKYWWALLAIFLYGLSDEFHQSWIPGREGKIRDALVDSLGGFLGWYLIGKYQKLKQIILIEK
jgi:VanZ family protein